MVTLCLPAVLATMNNHLDRLEVVREAVFVLRRICWCVCSHSLSNPGVVTVLSLLMLVSEVLWAPLTRLVGTFVVVVVSVCGLCAVCVWGGGGLFQR